MTFKYIQLYKNGIILESSTRCFIEIMAIVIVKISTFNWALQFP